MKTHNFILNNVDTDAISFSKPDGSKFSPEEFDKLIDEINSFLPDLIIMENDGYYEAFVVVKAKNYVMKIIEDGKTKIKFKGGSFKDSKKEPALSEMMKEISYSLLNGINYEELNTIYEKYVIEAKNPDIKRWATKKTASKAILDSPHNPEARENELKPWRAIKDKNLQEGDKFWVYTYLAGEKQKIVKGELQFDKSGNPKMEPDFQLKCIEDYDNDHVVEKLVARCWATLKIFETILDMDSFVNYGKKNNQQKLLDLDT